MAEERANMVFARYFGLEGDVATELLLVFDRCILDGFYTGSCGTAEAPGRMVCDHDR